MPARTDRALPLVLSAHALLVFAACAAPDELPPAPELGDLEGLSLLPAPTRVAFLAWQPPPRDCPLAYRVRVDDTYPPGFARVMHVEEEHSDAVLALGRGRLSEPTEGTWPAGPVPEGRVFEGQLVYRGPRTAGRELLREWALSATQLGPASPDAACFERTWDPIEDALALGWPALPGRRVAVGEVWTGARVEGRCNRSACIDPETRAGGKEAHERPCATMSWRERLDGVYLLGDARVAAISSFWSDGHPLDTGVWSERVALVDADSGRLVRAEISIHHNFTGVERQIRLDAVDTCPGGLVAAGYTPPEATLAEREALVAALRRAASGAAEPRAKRRAEAAPAAGR